MYPPKEIITGAQALLPHLKTLLGDEAESMERELSELLTQALGGQQVEMQILDVIDRHEATRTWLDEYVKDKQAQQGQKSKRMRRRLRPLPGIPLAPSPQLFRCPKGDYEWRRPAVGIPVPQCPTHQIDLISVP